MKNIVLILFFILNITSYSQSSLELCNDTLNKKIRAISNAEFTEWDVYPFTPYQVDDNSMLITFNNIGTYVIVAKFSNGYCDAESKIIIDVIECTETFLYVPSAFTPNGDGKNDEFGAYGLNIKEFSMVIYNRWGEIIFQSIDINNRWTGLYNNTYSQDDIYTYVINYRDLKNRYNQKIGQITLLK